MYQLTVNIANAGAPLSSGGSATVGHMWFTVPRGEAQPFSFGFAFIKSQGI